MYREAYQRGMLTIFFSVGSKPLAIWETHIQDGCITRFLDQEIKSMVLEIVGSNVSTTYMICPKGNKVLGITMPFLVMIVKNLKKYFSFEVTILDDTGTRRRFRVSNFQSTTQIHPLCTVMPIGLSEGWNQIQFNLAEFTRRAYKKQFVEVQKLKINANIRLRRVYFTEKIYPEDQLPAEYRLFFPLKGKYDKSSEKEPKLKTSASQQTIDIKKEGKIGVSVQTLKKPSKIQQEETLSRVLDVPQDTQKVTDNVSLQRMNASSAVFDVDVPNKIDPDISPEPITEEGEDLNKIKGTSDIENAEVKLQSGSAMVSEVAVKVEPDEGLPEKVSLEKADLPEKTDDGIAPEIVPDQEGEDLDKLKDESKIEAERASGDKLETTAVESPSKAEGGIEQADAAEAETV